MTTVFIPRSAENSELCQPVRQEDFELINSAINGTERASSWSPIEMKLIREDEGRVLDHSDAPWLGAHALVLRSNAVRALESLLTPNGEVLPLRCDTANVSLFNPLDVIDALDEEASHSLRFSDGRLMRIGRYVFRPEAIRGKDIFKIPNLRVSPTFVSQSFVTLWTRHRLKGLEFEEIWKS
jgi:hypothetical protein